jgi:uncharacterized membrane protein YfcA
MFMKKWLKHILIGLVTGLLNGLFGAGGGSIVVPAMELFLGIDSKQSHATAIAIILLLSSVSSFFYLRNGFFDLGLWIPVTIGGMAGGWVGAKVLSRISKSALKIIFGGIIMITALKLIF